MLAPSAVGIEKSSNCPLLTTEKRYPSAATASRAARRHRKDDGTTEATRLIYVLDAGLESCRGVYMFEAARRQQPNQQQHTQRGAMQWGNKYYGGVTVTSPTTIAVQYSTGSSNTTRQLPPVIVTTNASGCYSPSGGFDCGASVGGRRRYSDDDGAGVDLHVDFNDNANFGGSPANLQHQQGSNQRLAASTMFQVLIAFLVAGFGNVGAGLILNYVQEWPVFRSVSELFILVPALLGLKGNLEMTMASRLSTQANLGHMDSMQELLSMTKGNLALVQCQATVVSFSVAMFASVVKWQFGVDSGAVGTQAGGSRTAIGSTSYDPAMLAPSIGALVNGSTTLLATSSANTALMIGNQTASASNISQLLQAVGGEPATFLAADSDMMSDSNYYEGFNWDNALVLCASSLLTANIACFVLGTVMVAVIVGSHKLKIDPDNIAAPVAASLGDMTTAGLLAVVAHSIYFHNQEEQMPYLSVTIILLFFGMLPVWATVASTNPYTADVVAKGWPPIGIAVVISAFGGLILSGAKNRFCRLAVFQPVINGVGGNLVAVQASRLSTALHKTSKLGELPANSKQFVGPLDAFFETRKSRGNFNVTTARLLLLIAIPAHLLYFYVIRFIEGYSSTETTWLFVGLYVSFAMLQVAILLYLAQNLINILWKRKIDPDSYATPLLTATGDFLGCAFLLLIFLIAYHFEDPFAVVAESQQLAGDVGGAL